MIEKIRDLFSNVPYLHNKWIQAAIVIFLFIILAKVVHFVFAFYLKRFAKKTKTKADDMIFSKIKWPLFFLILFYGIQLALRIISAGKIIDTIFRVVVAIIVIVIVAKGINVIIEVWGTVFAKKTKTNTDEILLPFIHKVINVIFLIAGFLWILQIANINITPYLAGVGISGLVLGLALQDMLKNIFGGITLLLDKTYQIGDKVALEDGTVGEIHDIGLRSTKLMTYNNEIVYVPNGYLANSRVQNYTRPDLKVRTHVAFGVEYGTNIEKVRKVVLTALKKVEGIMIDPSPKVQFLEMGNFALNFKAHFWVENWDIAYGKKLEATEVIYNALNKAKIGIPFPTRTIHLKK